MVATNREYLNPTMTSDFVYSSADFNEIYTQNNSFRRSKVSDLFIFWIAFPFNKWVKAVNRNI